MDPNSVSMTAPKEADSFLFVVSTPRQRSFKGHQRLVKSHVSRRLPRRKRGRALPSWISQFAGENFPERESESSTLPTQIPARVGSDLSWIKFPSSPKPYMIQNVLRFFELVKLELYPVEICLWDEAVESSPITFLMSSPLFVNAVIFTIEAASDCRSGRPCGVRAQHHLLETLQLLQETLASQNDEQVSDHTIMTVNMLAMTAERLNDQDGMANHVEGLKQMVRLRGGFQKWKPYINDLQSKVCRADLGLAIRFGRQPLFFNAGISWSSYLNNNGQSSVADLESTDTLISFTQSLDWRLANVWDDLRQFSHLCNLGRQTGYKLRRQTFSEIIVSVLYRLLYLSFQDSPVDEAIRLGMLIFSSPIILQGQKCDSSILDAFVTSLFQIQGCSIGTPPPILFWLLTTWKRHVSADVRRNRLESWLNETTGVLDIHSWEQARKTLKSIMWIDVIHDPKTYQCIDSTGAKLIRYVKA